MNFFERQQHVRRMSARLVLLFAVAVFGIVLVINLAVVFAFNVINKEPVELAGVLIATTIISSISVKPSCLRRLVILAPPGSSRSILR